MTALCKFFVGMGLALILAFAAPSAEAQPYKLKPGDIVEITVLEDPSLNRRVLVGPDGSITLPLAGAVTAGDRTLGEVQNDIGARLRSQFVNPPSVTVSLVALGPPEADDSDDVADDVKDEVEVGSYYVLGEVNQPGQFGFKSEEPITILQALANAGGVGVFAARSRIQVRSLIREDADEGDTAAEKEDGAEEEAERAEAPLVESMRIFNYAALEDGAPDAAPFYIQDGDVIVVPERGLFE